MASIEEINHRRTLLKKLLAEGERAIGPGGRMSGPLKALADALSSALGMKLSVRSVQRDIAHLRKTAANTSLAINFRRGRPRHRDLEEAASRDVVTSMLYEAAVLSGLSASAVHALAVACALPFTMPSLATFYLDLDRLRLKPPKRARPPIEAVRDPAHTLRIHQLALQAPGGRWWVVLLAYDIRSSYVNAAVFDVHPPAGMERELGDKRLGPSLGRPVAKFHPRWRATLHAPDAPAPVELCPQAIVDFAQDTQSKMVLPVGMLILSKSLGAVDTLCDALSSLAPGRLYVSDAVQHDQAALLRTAAFRSSQLNWKHLAACLNRHNSAIAQPLLRVFRADIDAAEQTGVWPSHRLVALDRVRRAMIPDPSPFSANARERRAAFDADDASDLRDRIAAYKNTSPMRAHRGKHLALQPIRIRGSYSKLPSDAKAAPHGAD